MDPAALGLTPTDDESTAVGRPLPAGPGLLAPVWGPAPGERLGGYELLSKIGRGGQGEVWRARDLGSGELRAVKLLARDAADDARSVERFVREARLLSRLDHPGLVRVHQAGMAPDGRPWFAMDLVPDAVPLWMALRQGMEQSAALDALEQAADALASVHEAKLVHRDVKPGNVLIGADGRARLVDFGLVKGPDERRLSGSGETLGTPGYMAPEQLDGGDSGEHPPLGQRPRVGSWSDVFGLGALLHLILEGAPPPFGPDGEPRPMVGLGHDPGLRDLCLNALESDPLRRPPDAASFVHELRRVRRPAVSRPIRRRALEPVRRGLVAVARALRAHPVLTSLLPLLVPAAIVALLSAPAPAVTPGAPSAAPVTTAVGQAALPAALRPGPAPGQAIGARDGSLLLWVGPGTLRMGSEAGDADERPVLDVPVAGFWLAARELDRGRYLAFCERTGRHAPSAEIAGAPPFVAGDEHPIFGVTLFDARAYCEWAGLRLPREAEWEWAARGADGRTFPWGDALPQDGRRVANLADLTARRIASPPLGACEEGYDDGALWPAPVGSFADGASPWGCLDLAGNVWEWTDDPYGPYGQPPSPEGDLQVARGGSWDNPAQLCRASNRGRIAPTTRAPFLGFRVASSN